MASIRLGSAAMGWKMADGLAASSSAVKASLESARSRARRFRSGYQWPSWRPMPAQPLAASSSTHERSRELDARRGDDALQSDAVDGLRRRA